MWAFAFVGDFGDIRSILSGGPLDRILNIILREILRFCIVNRYPQRGVGFRIWPTVFSGHRDGFSQLRKNLGHGSPSGFLGAAAAFKVSTHN